MSRSSCTALPNPLPTVALAVVGLAPLTCGPTPALASGRATTSPPTIERIHLNGNRTVRDRVIRRELLVSVGDRFDIQPLVRTRRRLMRLGFFRSVTITVLPGSTNDRIVLDVRVAEKPTGTFFVFVGCGHRFGPRGPWPLRPLRRRLHGP